MKRPKSGGGLPAILYTLRKAHAAGGFMRMWKALRSRNACKTCALGMGGQGGGMVNEAGRFPEVCKKSVQAMAADLQGRIREGFFETFSIRELGAMSPRELEAAGRLTAPLYAGPADTHYREIPWDEAIERAADALRHAPPDESFFYASGRSSNEAGFLLQLVARLHGTNNVNNCSFFCHNASGVGLKEAIGSGAGTITLEDLDQADLVFVIGANPASNHPRLLRNLVELKRRGGKVVVVNPLREVGLEHFRVPSDVRSMLFGSTIADEYVMPHIAGDAAFFIALAKGVLEARGEDAAFIEAHTQGFAEWRRGVEASSWEDLAASAGVEVEQIRRVAAMYGRARAAVFCWTMGITHQIDGVGGVHAIVNCALLRGMVGRAGAGLLPLRGHSNVQGMGTVGVVPVPSRAFLDGLEARYGVPMPRGEGLDTLACLERADAGKVRFALHLGGNLYGSAPDSAWATRALQKIGCTVFLSTTLNSGHVHGRGGESLVLPVLARDEEPQPTTQESMFSFVRMSDGGAPRHVGPRAEVAVIAAIARRGLTRAGPVDLEAMEKHASLREGLAALVPELAQLAGIERSKQEFVVPGRILHAPEFKTPTGRAVFKSVAPGPVRAPGDMRLMTIRSEGQFNTVVYEEEDFYRGQERRDVILMAREDMDRLKLHENDIARVETDSGFMDVLVRESPIRPGNVAMYYPEANVLVPARVDTRSRTPAFKDVRVRVRRSPTLNVVGGG